MTECSYDRFATQGAMGALQARLVFFAFVGLAAVIAYNALYLQDGPHPGAFSADMGSLQPGSRAVSATGALPETEKAGAETVRAVQEQLAAKGYDPGPVDGVHGLLTRAAVMAFQYDHDLPLTGEVSDRLLKQILFGAGSEADSGADPDIPEETAALIRAVKERLLPLGDDFSFSGDNGRGATIGTGGQAKACIGG
jgi:hypothetical protein